MSCTNSLIQDLLSSEVCNFWVNPFIWGFLLLRSRSTCISCQWDIYLVIKQHYSFCFCDSLKKGEGKREREKEKGKGKRKGKGKAIKQTAGTKHRLDTLSCCFSSQGSVLSGFTGNWKVSVCFCMISVNLFVDFFFLICISFFIIHCHRRVVTNEHFLISITAWQLVFFLLTALRMIFKHKST